MAKSPYTCAVMLGLAIFATGCTNKSPKEPNEYQIALKQVSTEWTTPCPVLGAAPENSVGALLSDYSALAEVQAICAARHSALINYLAPLVQKAKAE